MCSSLLRISLAAAIVLALAARPATAAPAPWLFVTDVHFDPSVRKKAPAPPGDDTNAALLDSAIAEMRRVDPHPPVVVIGGDFLAHHFDGTTAEPTMAGLARRFDAAFPKAQFVITLGNEDSPCGDYALAPNSRFLRAVAAAWAPLVDRGGAAPSFRTSFARDGFYRARLPLAHLEIVVADDVYWSPRYHGCGATGNPGTAAIAELQRALHADADRHWLLVHIPPGIDAYSTAHLVHRLAVVPFLDPAPRDALLQTIADPGAHVTLVLAAHTHKFAYRIAGTNARPVPLLLMPSISPIFRNAPAFLTAEVDPDGTLRDVDDHAFVKGKWRDLGGLNDLGVPRLTGSALVDLHERLDRDANLRGRFDRLYESGGEAEIDDRNWPVYRCAATAFTSTAFRECAGEGGLSFLTSRGIRFIIAGVALVLAVGVILIVRRRRSKRRA